MLLDVNDPAERHTYQAIFNDGKIMDGAVACPTCRSSALHPTGHSAPIDLGVEYGPDLSLTAWCECGQTVEIRLGNYKGHLGIDVVAIGTSRLE